MPSFSTALSGLESNNTTLNTIANNLANMNTIGYKNKTSQFSTLFYQQLNSNVQVGVGTQIATTSTNFSNGGVSNTGESTNMALQGNGFFIVNDQGQQELTRAGDFVLSANGALQTTTGASVMGYPGVSGKVSVASGIQPLVLPLSQTLAAKQTSSISIGANLDASAKVGTSVPAPVTLYDSQGFAHQATVKFTKTGTNTWSYSVTLPSGEAKGGTGTSGTLTFDGSGNLKSPTGKVNAIKFTGLSDGAQNLSFSWNLGADNSDTITQTASPSNVAAVTQDGYTSGSYKDFTVDESGLVQATYSNGQKQTVGQVAVATVANLQGLQATNNTAYLTTRASGDALVGTAGTGGRGSITGGALESSNVDISTEFSALIVAQRAFEANSKTVTTFDQATQEAINMIH